MFVGIYSKAKRIGKQLRLWENPVSAEDLRKQAREQTMSFWISAGDSENLNWRNKNYFQRSPDSCQLLHCQPFSGGSNKPFLVRYFCLNKKLLVSYLQPHPECISLLLIHRYVHIITEHKHLFRLISRLFLSTSSPVLFLTSRHWVWSCLYTTLLSLNFLIWKMEMVLISVSGRAMA